MFCHKCRAKVADNSSFCHSCGEKLIQDDIAKETLGVFPSNSEPLTQTSTLSVQPIEQENIPTDNVNDFKAFADNHVRSTTKFQSIVRISCSYT